MKKVNVIFERDKALKTIDVTIRASERDNDVEALIGRISDSSAYSIPVTDENGSTYSVPARCIVLLSVNGKRVNIITDDNKYISRLSLNSIEENLDPSEFIRISRFEIINLKKVLRYDFSLSGTLRIELFGGMETWASRRCIPLIRKRLSGKE